MNLIRCARSVLYRSPGYVPGARSGGYTVGFVQSVLPLGLYKKSKVRDGIDERSRGRSATGRACATRRKARFRVVGEQVSTEARAPAVAVYTRSDGSRG